MKTKVYASVVLMLVTVFPVFTIETENCDVDKIVQQIGSGGPGTRLTLPSFRTVKGTPTGTLKLTSTTTENQYEYDVVAYADEGRTMRFDNFGTLTAKSGSIEYGKFADLRFPTGSKSVFVFKGKVRIGTTTFVGNNDDPLFFALLDQHGLVYLCGSGRVKLPSGKEVSLPSASPLAKGPVESSPGEGQVVPHDTQAKLNKYFQSCSEGSYLAVEELGVLYVVQFLKGKFTLLKTIRHAKVDTHTKSGMELAPGVWCGKGEFVLKPYGATYNISNGFTIREFDEQPR